MLLRATHCITGQLIEFTSYRTARKQGFYHRDIRACLQGKRKSYRGYYWATDPITPDTVTRPNLVRTQLEILILKQGVTIDECADKFNIKPQHVCKIMGWE